MMAQVHTPTHIMILFTEAFVAFASTHIYVRSNPCVSSIAIFIFFLILVSDL